jgi:hypothetical protein
MHEDRDASTSARRWWPGIRGTLVLLFLMAQVAGIVWGRVSGESFWAWAPHDSIVDYAIDAWHGGSVVARAGVEARYGLPAGGRRYEPVADLIAVVRTRDARLQQPDHCVRVTYRVNEGARQTWAWPAGCAP